MRNSEERGKGPEQRVEMKDALGEGWRERQRHRVEGRKKGRMEEKMQKMYYAGLLPPGDRECGPELCSVALVGLALP